MRIRVLRVPLLPALITLLTLAGWASPARSLPTFDLPVASTIPSITTPGCQVTIPISLTGFTQTGNSTRGLRLSVGLSANLTYAGGSTAAVASGLYLTTGAGAVVRVVTPPSATTGIVTIDVGITGSCPTGGASGVILNLLVGTNLTSGTATGSVTLSSVNQVGDATPVPTLRDCAGAVSNPVVTYGAASVTGVAVNIDLTQNTTLITTPVKTGNGAITPVIAGINAIHLSWTNPTLPASSTADIYRGPFGYEFPPGTWVNSYPEYNDNELFIARPPTTPTGTAVPPLGWVKVNSAPIATIAGIRTFDDKPPERGFWYYVVQVTSPLCGPGLVSAMSGGTLDYFLADVSPAPTTNPLLGGDNKVDTGDKSALGSAYGVGELDLTNFKDYLDFGPTSDHSVDGRPTPDDFINFEDLMIYSMNFNKNGTSPQFAGSPAPADHDELTVDAPTRVQAGQTFAVTLRLKGAGDLQGISTQLGWDRAVAEPAAVEPGALIEAQDGIVLSAGPGDVDVAVSGVDRPGLSGEGVMASVRFRALAAGNPGIRVASLDARDRSNEKVELSASVPNASLSTAFAPVTPNPFQHGVALDFSLAKSGRAELGIYSVDGRRVKTLASGARAAGAYHLAWDGTDDGGRVVKPGMFFAKLLTPDGHFTRTLVKVQ